jgi:hypothetical protein
MSYKLPKNIKDAGQLFESFDQAGEAITGIEMLDATLRYASEHRLMSGEICILLDNLVCKAGARVVSAMLNPTLCQELSTDICSESMDAIMQVAARARAAVKAVKDGVNEHPEWDIYGDADWLNHFGDAAWAKQAKPSDLKITVAEYEKAQKPFLDALHTMEGHYCVVGDGSGVSLIHTEDFQSGYNPDLNYDSKETVCDSSGFCQLIDLSENANASEDELYSDEWSLDYVREYTNREKAGETVYYEASTVSHANDPGEMDMVDDHGEVLETAGDHGIVVHEDGDHCHYDPMKNKKSG